MRTLLDLVEYYTPWLVPAIGIALLVFLVLIIFKALSGMRVHRVLSQDVTHAYRYFKRVLDRLEKGGDEVNGDTKEPIQGYYDSKDGRVKDLSGRILITMPFEKELDAISFIRRNKFNVVLRPPQ